MACRQRRIVAPDLGAGPLRVVQEVEVVDGDDLRGRRAGINSGMSEWATSTAPASQSTGGHPAGARQSSATRTGIRASTTVAPGTAAGCQPVLPGARKQHQAVRLAQDRRQRAGQLVHVLADAGPLPERRAIVEQDAHARGIVAVRPEVARAQLLADQ